MYLWRLYLQNLEKVIKVWSKRIMCDKSDVRSEPANPSSTIRGASSYGNVMDNTFYKLNQQKEYLIQQLIIVQNAIDAVKLTSHI